MVSRWPAALASGSRLSSSSARSRPSIAAPSASKERLPKVIRPDSSAGRRGQARRAVALTVPSASSRRSEEHTSELQSLMRRSYAVFRLKKQKTNTHTEDRQHHTNMKRKEAVVTYK